MPSPSGQFVPTRSQRIAAIMHIVYEYANLMAAGHYSIHGQAPWRTHCDDAFLLGCRKLDDFLMNEKRSIKRGLEMDDVLARDYLPTGLIQTWNLPIWRTEWRDAMNKQLAHIAYSRGKSWDHRIWTPRLRTEFRKAWWEFRSAVIDDGYSQEFDRQLTNCQAKIGFGNIALQAP